MLWREDLFLCPRNQLCKVVVIVGVVLYLLSVLLPFAGMGAGFHTLGPCR